jgi:hypothetical protein
VGRELLVAMGGLTVHWPVIFNCDSKTNRDRCKPPEKNWRDLRSLGWRYSCYFTNEPAPAECRERGQGWWRWGCV